MVIIQFHWENGKLVKENYSVNLYIKVTKTVIIKGLEKQLFILFSYPIDSDVDNGLEKLFLFTWILHLKIIVYMNLTLKGFFNLKKYFA